MKGRVADVIIYFQFYQNRLGVSELWGAKIGGLPYLWPSPLQQVSTTVLPVIEHFSQGVTAEALRAIIASKSAILPQRGPVDPKFQVEEVAPHQPFFF